MHARRAALRSVSPPGHLQAVGQRVERRANSTKEALHRRSRSVAVAHSVMSKARQLEIVRLRATALGDRQQVVDLEQMGRGAAAPGERVAITAASSVA